MIAALVAGVLVTQGVMVRAGDSTGQLCPISPITAYTAAHVVSGHLFGEWEASTGQRGVFRVTWRDDEKDLALLSAEAAASGQSVTPFPFSYPVRKTEPPVGEMTGSIGMRQWGAGWYPSPGYYLGLDTEGDMAVMMPVHFGMSGGCIVTEEKGVREVAGIVSGVMMQEKTGWPVGFGRPVWRGKGGKR